MIVIRANNSTPAGTYELTFRISSGGVTVTKCKTLNYRALPTVSRNPITGTIPPFDAKSQLDNLMVTKGAYHCNHQKILQDGTWESGVWYYDGMNNYHSIAEYTKNASWYICSDWVAEVYRDGYVLANCNLFKLPSV